VIIPPLYSETNPTAPQWTGPIVQKSEVRQFSSSLALVVGVDRASGTYEALGTGFIIAIGDHLQILTASHVIQDFANRIWGPVRHNAFRGIDPIADSKEEQPRTRRLIEEALIRVYLQCTPGEGFHAALVRIIACTVGIDRGQYDYALLQCEFPPGAGPKQFVPFVIDLEPPPFTEPVIIAGFAPARSHRSVPLDRPDLLIHMRRKCMMRAGFIAEVEREIRDGRRQFRRYRANIPSEPGMSGGPMIRLRPTGPGRHACTSAGVISRSRVPGQFPPLHCPEGETMVGVMEDALFLTANFAEGSISLAQQIERGIIATYQRLAAEAGVS
jgi:Trypsin-like peptidase domain